MDQESRDELKAIASQTIAQQGENINSNLKTLCTGALTLLRETGTADEQVRNRSASGSDGEVAEGSKNRYGIM